VDRCDRAALEDAAYEHLVGRGHWDRLARLDDLNSLAPIRHDAGQLFKLPNAIAQCVNCEFGAPCWRRYDHRAGKHLSNVALGDQVSDAIELAGSAGLQSHHMVDPFMDG
jgi:hypothetical protein